MQPLAEIRFGMQDLSQCAPQLLEGLYSFSGRDQFRPLLPVVVKINGVECNSMAGASAPLHEVPPIHDAHVQVIVVPVNGSDNVDALGGEWPVWQNLLDLAAILVVQPQRGRDDGGVVHAVVDNRALELVASLEEHGPPDEEIVLAVGGLAEQLQLPAAGVLEVRHLLPGPSVRQRALDGPPAPDDAQGPVLHRLEDQVRAGTHTQRSVLGVRLGQRRNGPRCRCQPRAARRG
mmetsp:Transcript_667/g.1937  ORF Transcript_667/g.1937 Transcript_667/m.1937 type:complete len:233 (+) Transcript_667:995-1693(+)